MADPYKMKSTGQCTIGLTLRHLFTHLLLDRLLQMGPLASAHNFNLRAGPVSPSSSANSIKRGEATKSADPSFQVLYFAVHGRGELIRAILSYAAIERYLAKKLDLYGKNEYEQHKLEEYLSSTDGALLAHCIQVVRAVDIPPEKRVEQTNKFYAEEVLKFINIHKVHLEKNGSNGHHMSGSTTLADLKTALFIDRVFYIPQIQWYR
ncbi:hypothetical protein BGX34_005672 [Mortierella sp. NVP85]|nr:hypothetical protein BGX34_005672 [Mortierella sp. NVP85]